MSQINSSQYLKWFNQIEKALWSFFRLFDDLCDQCYKKTIEQINNNSRDNRTFWCCCLTDNQVHDNWQRLNQIQTNFEKIWYNDLGLKAVNPINRRLPGNGPCPALGANGCLLAKCRPITCTTQLCEKMLYVLNQLNLVNCQYKSPMQIEDLITLQDILPELYGVRNKRLITQKDVSEYLRALNVFKNKFKQIPKELVKEKINQAMDYFHNQKR